MMCLVRLVSIYLVAEESSAHSLFALAVGLLKNTPPTHDHSSTCVFVSPASAFVVETPWWLCRLARQVRVKTAAVGMIFQDSTFRNARGAKQRADPRNLPYNLPYSLPCTYIVGIFTESRKRGTGTSNRHRQLYQFEVLHYE